MVKRIEHLHDLGVRVAVGSDGYGILGERSRFDFSLARFKEQGMSEASLQKLMEEAYTPFHGSRLGQSTRQAWDAEKLEVQNALERVSILDSRTERGICLQRALERLIGN